MASAIRNPKDFYSGLMFAAFGLAAVVIGRDYPMGSALRMGPGYFPTVLGWILLVLGGILAIRATLRAGEPLGGAGIRGVVLVLGAVAFFAGLINVIGLAACVAAVVIISSLANTRVRWLEVTLLAIVLIGLGAQVFVKGLGLPFKLWPV